MQAKSRRLTAIIFSGLSLLLAACGEPADTHPNKPVTQRRDAFKKIVKTFEPMGVQLRNDRYDPVDFLGKANELVRLKETPWQYFGPDSNYPPTKAKASIWERAAEFEKERQSFVQAVDKLQIAAQSRDEKRVKPAYEAVHETCRSCHKAFKQ